MLRFFMSVLSSLEIGIRLKERLEAAKRQSIVGMLAAIFLLMAAAFGLVTAYFALSQAAGLSPLLSAAIIAVVLFVIALLLFALIPLFGRKKLKPKPERMVDAGTESLAMADEGLSKAMQQVGPIAVLAVAFIAGVLASRRKD